MNKEVLIAFKGTQSDGEDTDKVELFTEGKFYKKGSSYYVTYAESELTGMEGTTTTLKINCIDNIISMTRFGKNSTHLVFEKGKKHLSCYETGYGALTVGVSSDYVDIDISESGGSIAAKYSIDVNSRLIGQNDFNITITERNITNEYQS